MTGSDVGDKINAAAIRCAEQMRTPREAHVGADAYASLMEYANASLGLDMHEVCGDYDRPSSPWFGGRPEPPALRWYAPGGDVAVIKRPELREAVIVVDTDGTPWIGEEP
jgi:hypothetical protein